MDNEPINAPTAQRVELVVPAGGTLEHVREAVRGGADAVYLGVHDTQRRSLLMPLVEYPLHRAAEAIGLCHRAGRRVHITFNSYYRDADYERILARIALLSDMGADAFIVTDLALIKLLLAERPDVEVHASVQIGAANSATVAWLARLGVKRIIVERLVSIAEIAHIKETTAARLEVFVFGGMCSSYHTFCHIPSHLFGITCLSPCMDRFTLADERSSDNGYFLKSRALNAMGMLPGLIRAGVDAFKVEGRTKNPRYGYQVARAFRSAIDEVLEHGGLSPNKARDQLLFGQVPPRSSLGFLNGWAGSESIDARPGWRDRYWDLKPFLGRKGVAWYLQRRRLRQLDRHGEW